MKYNEHVHVRQWNKTEQLYDGKIKWQLYDENVKLLLLHILGHIGNAQSTNISYILWSWFYFISLSSVHWRNYNSPPGRHSLRALVHLWTSNASSNRRSGTLAPGLPMASDATASMSVASMLQARRIGDGRTDGLHVPPCACMSLQH